ncbi:MAG: hypothetical protein Q4E55_07400 [Bacteroidales bacterium]|nr:hypothetical protein [Bacteroidales bacterium]
MKKTLFFGLMAAALTFTSCSSDNDSVLDEATQQGMVLRATVEQPAEARATIDNRGETWQFAFTLSDKVRVTNTTLISDYYTFTNKGKDFECEDAKPTSSAADWYAYFPWEEINLIGQSGTLDNVAKLYALAGSQSNTVGEKGLSITMQPQVAILKITNNKGEININVKTSLDNYVTGLEVKDKVFEVQESTTFASLFTTSDKKTNYDIYIVVPAGKQLSIKDGGNTVKSTLKDGLTAGCYYELTIPESK